MVGYRASHSRGVAIVSRRRARPGRLGQEGHQDGSHAMGPDMWHPAGWPLTSTSAQAAAQVGRPN